MSLQAFLSAMTEQSAPSCQRCGSQPSVICKMLDPTKGETIRIFKCQCGEMTTSRCPS
jgi:hypothetical protein